MNARRKLGSIHAAMWRLCWALVVVLLSVGTGCSITRYTEGPLTGYLKEPLPELQRPLARTFSLEIVAYNTAGGMKATDIGDTTGRELHILPSDVGTRVAAAIRMDDGFNEAATLSALNALFEHKGKARAASGTQRPTINTTGLTPPDTEFITKQEALARQAYDQGNYLEGDIHLGAAMHHARASDSIAQAQSAANTAFAVHGLMASVGTAIIETEFQQMHHWLATESGAVGAAAPERSHLSVFILQYFDAKWGGAESRQRVAVHLALIDGNGKSSTLLEGSDVMLCINECDVFPLRPGARPLNPAELSPDIRQLYSQDGIDQMNARGFNSVGGIYAYPLLKHGFRRLTSMAEAEPQQHVSGLR